MLIEGSVNTLDKHELPLQMYQSQLSCVRRENRK